MSPESKRRAAEAAAALVRPGSIVGVGTGSTAELFIEALGRMRDPLAAAVASSEASARHLAAVGVHVAPLAEFERLPLYVDGADEVDPRLRLIKGGGGALTREKIVAAASECFVCIVDESKPVERLGAFPLPVEVIPMARRQVAAALRAIGGRPVERQGFVTDDGNLVLDVHGLEIADPAGLETTLNQIPGAVTNGLFALRPADVVLVGSADGVRRMGRLDPSAPPQ